ncbi:hypothetical protein QCA50_004355 [Cerrena zonata]|uniref:Amidohydrolase-related domain-containing protein n=1 Tax=Cerrena zonata TaxID=2478898 RepID=A0AAW0GJ83_9APHY
MEKDNLDPTGRTKRSSTRRVRLLHAYLLLAVSGALFYFGQGYWSSSTQSAVKLPPHAATSLARCRSLQAKPGPSRDFYKRSQSDRFEEGTQPILIKNAKIWTGDINGTEVISADVLLDKGIIKGIGRVETFQLKAFKDDLVVIDAKNAWVTPGIVDLHSHVGDSPLPDLNGAQDDNSLLGTAQPWLRALDGLNTHDDSFLLSIAGGVTTALVLPGSANAIGGQGFTIKLRSTTERSPSSMLLEPPYQINSSFFAENDRPRWRQMKHACGENPSSVYHYTRMDNLWAFREVYNKAREIKTTQDQYCNAVLGGDWATLNKSPFPEDLQWEALVDVLRGRVKVQVHCYEAVDLDDFVRLTQEFQFPVAAFHHAHEAYLVPDVLKKAYEHPPAVAMFAAVARYKREAYRGSGFAPRILAEHGLPVVMKSDSPAAIHSRDLLFEAQQAHYYGLPEHLALASVTTTPADTMGIGHRVGYIKEGWDADLVIWDSHPLALGATPVQVIIDGIPQLPGQFVVEKPQAFQVTPKVPNFDKEANETVEYEGLPPLEPEETVKEIVVFTNVKSIYSRTEESIQESFLAQEADSYGVAVVEKGVLKCFGSSLSCDTQSLLQSSSIPVVDLEGGSLSPGLITYGAPVGLEEINQEPSTTDGYVPDPLMGSVPKVVGGDGALIRAVDGLQFGGRDALMAYRAGVTAGIVAPMHDGFLSGLSTSFSTGARHKLASGAVIQDVNALHVTIRHFGSPSVSTQIGTLRHLLLHPDENTPLGTWFKKVTEGKETLVVEADNADIIATLVVLKREVERAHDSKIKLTISGGVEAYLLAKELARAHIGVIQVPARPFPGVWEQRRILPGPPLTEKSSIMELLDHNVTVGLGIVENWAAHNTRFDLAWVAIGAGGRLSKADTIALASTNLEKLLGGGGASAQAAHDLVATKGGDLLDFESKVVAVISPKRGTVDLL